MALSSSGGAPPMDPDDWRAQLPHDSRQRIVNNIMETLNRHLPFYGQEGLQELRKIAVTFEENNYSAAASQSDYLRKISSKMLTMETKSHSPMAANSLQPGAANASRNPSDLASLPELVHVLEDEELVHVSKDGECVEVEEAFLMRLVEVDRTISPNLASRIKQKKIEEDCANIFITISDDSSRFPYKRHVVAAKSSSVEGGKDYQEPLQVRGLELFIFRVIKIMSVMYFAFSYGIFYLTTGHRFVEQHETLVEIYKKYSRSHFIIALEAMFLLTAYQIYGATGQISKAFLLFSFSMWFIVISWLFAPFVLNPCGFKWPEVERDWIDWSEWMSYNGSMYGSKSWESWWGEEQEHLRYTGFFGRFCKIIFHLRFFVYHYVLVYQLHVANIDQSIVGYVLLWSWPVIVAAMVILKIVSMIMKKRNVDLQLMCRFLELSLFIVGNVIFIVMCGSLTMGEFFSCLLVFLPTGWGILQIAQACRPFVEGLGMWGMVKALASGYDSLMGIIIFLPVVDLAFFSVVSELQPVMLLHFKSKLSADAFRLGAFLPPVQRRCMSVQLKE